LQLVVVGWLRCSYSWLVGWLVAVAVGSSVVAGWLVAMVGSVTVGWFCVHQVSYLPVELRLVMLVEFTISSGWLVS
jgi:hypothetical protein